MPRILFDEDSDLSDFETELGIQKEKPRKKTDRSDSDDSDQEGEDSEESVSDEGDLIEDDSDDAPEDISFSSGRETALTAMKSAMVQIKKDQLLTKDKRRKQDEQNRKQREEKLALLAKRKLPDDFLESVSKTKKKDGEEVRKRSKKEQKKADIVQEESDESLGFDESEHFDEESPDLIPLGKSVSGFQVVSVKDISKAKSLSEDALNFRQSKLYGGEVRRQSVKSKMAIAAKKKVTASRR